MAQHEAHRFDRPLPIEDYGLIGDGTTAALVGRNGSIDWLCWPRFDSGACFAALLGDARHGRWPVAPRSTVIAYGRRDKGDTMILETVFETESGTVALIDLLPADPASSSLIRRIECVGMQNVAVKYVKRPEA